MSKNPAQQTGRDVQMVNCNTEQGRCKACQRKGWPVMLVRRVFSAETKDITSDFTYRVINAEKDPPSPLFNALRHTSSDRRNVRMLREGHLYALVANSAGQVIYTYHYAVTPEGYLRLASVVNSSNSEVKKFPPSCQVNGHGVNAACIHIDDEYIGHGNKLLLAFANDEWCSSVLNNYQQMSLLALISLHRFKVLDIDTLVTDPAAAATVSDDDNFASSYHGVASGRIGGRGDVKSDVHNLLSARVIPLEMAYLMDKVPTAHPCSGDWHGKSLNRLYGEFINNYRNANTTPAERQSAPQTPYRVVNVHGTTVYEITHPDGRVERADRPPPPLPNPTTQNYRNVEARISSRKVPLVIVDDPVGDVWELNFMRQALELDRYIWSADPERLVKRLSQQTIQSILDQHFRACDGKNLFCYVGKPAADHFYNYYDNNEVIGFAVGYDFRLSDYNRTLTSMIEKYYVGCWSSPMLATVLANDYAKDATDASAEDRQSATALTKMLGSCLEGGVLYIKYKDEEKQTEVDFDAQENAVLRLWKSWLGNPRSYLYQAIFRNNTVLLNKLEALFNGAAMDAIDAQTLVTNYLAPFAGQVELDNWWRRDDLRPFINALVFGVISARQLLETEARTAQKTDCMMQIAAGLYENLQFVRRTMQMTSTEDLENAINNEGLKDQLISAASADTGTQDTWFMQITPKIELDQKVAEVVSWGAIRFDINFRQLSQSSVPALDRAFASTMAGGVSKAAVNAFSGYYLFVSIQQSYRKLSNVLVGEQTATRISALNSLINLGTLAGQAVAGLMAISCVMAARRGASLSSALIGNFITISGTARMAEVVSKYAGRVAVFVSITEAFMAAFRYWESKNQNSHVQKYRLAALLMYSCVAVLAVIGLAISSWILALVCAVVSLVAGLLAIVFDMDAEANSHSPIDRWIHRSPWGRDKPPEGLTTPRMPEGVPYRWDGANIDLMMTALLAASKGLEPYIGITAVNGSEQTRVTFQASMPGYKDQKSGFSALGYVQRTGSDSNRQPVNYAVFKRKSGNVRSNDTLDNLQGWRAGPNLAENIASQTPTADDIVISRSYDKVPGEEDAEKLVVESELQVRISSVAFAVIHAKYWPDYERNSRECAEVVYAEGSRRHYSLALTRWMGELLF